MAKVAIIVANLEEDQEEEEEQKIKKTLGVDQEGHYELFDVNMGDDSYIPGYTGFNVIWKYKYFLMQSVWVFIMFGLAIGTSLVIHHNYQDKDYDYYDTAGRWAPVAVGGVCLVCILQSCCVGCSFRGPFKRSTWDLLLNLRSNEFQQHMLQCHQGVTWCGVVKCGISRANFITCNINKVRTPLLVSHLFYCGFLIWMWNGLHNKDIVDSMSQYQRIRESSDQMRNLVWGWIVFSPTLANMVDYGMLKLYDARHDSSIPRHGRGWWTSLSNMHKLHLWLLMTLFIDPSGEHFFLHDDNSTTEKVWIWVLTALTLSMLVLFWVNYHSHHIGIVDKPFAYVDFPTTLVLLASYVYLLKDRLENKHESVKPTHDFMLQMGHLIFGFIGMLNIPSNIDFICLQTQSPVPTTETSIRDEINQADLASVSSPFTIEMQEE